LIYDWKASDLVICNYCKQKQRTRPLPALAMINGRRRRLWVCELCCEFLTEKFERGEDVPPPEDSYE